ncbi:hypothetical protein ACIB24_14395 [Spongisporangium articulatum]|uniref:Integral membrane protein n=1 Tax=Spongisporangium articulatum TaxID=3362603 RepID=A0ABW8APE6_9ACTN
MSGTGAPPGRAELRRDRSRRAARTPDGPGPVEPAGADVVTVPLTSGPAGTVLRLRVVPTAWLLIVVHLVLTATRLARGWWWQDDLNLLALARRPFGTDLLFADYNGHLVPGTFAIAWLVDRIGPLTWWPAATAIWLLTAATDLALLALLRRMFGNRPGILVPLGMFCATAVTLTSTLWWAAAMQWLPVTFALVASLYGHIGYWATGRLRDLAVAVGAILFGLLFFEKALTVLVVLGLYAVAYQVSGTWLTRPFRALWAHPFYWLLQLGLAVGFLVAYLGRVQIDTGGPQKSGLGDYLTLVRYMVLESFLPSLVGGPLRWLAPNDTATAWPGPVWPLTVLALLVCLATVVLTARLHPGAWRGWALLGVFVTVSVVLVARTRLGFVGPLIGRDTRYITDTAAMAAVALGLAIMPLRPGLDAGLARPNGRPGPSWVFGTGGRVAVGGLVTVLVMSLGGLVSGETYMGHWTKNPTRTYFDNLRSSLDSQSDGGTRPVRMFPDETLPESVMTATFEDSRKLTYISRMLDQQPTFVGSAAELYTVTEDGRVVRAAVDSSPVSLPTTCSTDGRLVVRLSSRVIEWRWKLQLSYLTNRAGSATVQLGTTGSPVRFDLAKGLGSVFVDVPGGPANTLVIDDLGSTTLCLGAYALGNKLKPAPT